MNRFLSHFALALLAACSPSATDSPAPPSPAPAKDEAPPLVPLGTLVGEYRVAGIDGAPLDAPFGLALSVTEDRIVFDAPCNGYAWTYRLEGAALRTARSSSPDPACLATARIHHLVFDLAAALDAVRSAGRDTSNAVVLSGGGRSVTLYSQ